jgi:hypothetical protein
MLADQAKCQQTDMLFRAAIAKSKLQREKEVEEEVVAREALKARAADRAEDAMKHKNEKSSRHYFPNFPLRSEGTVDLATASPIKKKHKNKAALSTVIEIDMDLEEKEDSEEKEDLEEMEDPVARKGRSATLGCGDKGSRSSHQRTHDCLSSRATINTLKQKVNA